MNLRFKEAKVIAIQFLKIIAIQNQLYCDITSPNYNRGMYSLEERHNLMSKTRMTEKGFGLYLKEAMTGSLSWLPSCISMLAVGKRTELFTTSFT